MSLTQRFHYLARLVEMDNLRWIERLLRSSTSLPADYLRFLHQDLKELVLMLGVMESGFHGAPRNDALSKQEELTIVRRCLQRIDVLLEQK
jgi:hypothetical protein